MDKHFPLIKDMHSIVVVGELNPPLFHPLWFSKYELIKENEAQESIKSNSIRLVHNDLTAFSLNWSSVEVNRNKWTISCTEKGYFEVIRDLASSTFHILKNTPVFAVGINYEGHYDFRSQERYDEFINNLKPSKSWNNAFSQPKSISWIIHDFNRPERDKDYNIIKETTLTFKDVPDNDLNLIKEGAIFYLLLGYEINNTGSKSKAVQIRFKRTHKFSKTDFDAALDWRNEHKDLFE